MTLQRVSQNCLRFSAAHSGCIPPTKYAFLFMPGAPSSLPSGLFGCCSGADSFFRLRFEVSTHSLFSTDRILSFLCSSDVSGLLFCAFSGVGFVSDLSWQLERVLISSVLCLASTTASGSFSIMYACACRGVLGCRCVQSVPPVWECQGPFGSLGSDFAV